MSLSWKHTRCLDIKSVIHGSLQYMTVISHRRKKAEKDWRVNVNHKAQDGMRKKEKGKLT